MKRMLMMVLAIGLVSSVTGCATGPFQARKAAWARNNAMTYGWQPVYIGNGQTRYAPTALTRQIKSADQVAMQVATGQMRSISESELANVIDPGGSFWARVGDSSLAASLGAVATWGIYEAATGGKDSKDSKDSERPIAVNGNGNTVITQGGQGNNNTAGRDQYNVGEGGAVNQYAPAPATEAAQ